MGRRTVVPKDSPLLRSTVRSVRIQRYPTGPIFLNPLIYGRFFAFVSSSLIDPENSLITRKISLLPILKFPVNFAGNAEVGTRKLLGNRGLLR